jgi:hypothetical protein
MRVAGSGPHVLQGLRKIDHPHGVPHPRDCTLIRLEALMRRILKWTGIFLAVVILAVVSLPFLINVDQFRPTL